MRVPGRYILIGQTAVPEPDLMTWAEWLEAADRIVARTEIGATVVSTVFLGLDHQNGDGAPLLFETMVFTDGEPDSQFTRRRYSTWFDAETQHAEIVQEVKRRQCPA